MLPKQPWGQVSLVQYMVPGGVSGIALRRVHFAQSKPFSQEYIHDQSASWSCVLSFETMFWCIPTRLQCGACPTHLGTSARPSKSSSSSSMWTTASSSRDLSTWQRDLSAGTYQLWALGILGGCGHTTYMSLTVRGGTEYFAAQGRCVPSNQRTTRLKRAWESENNLVLFRNDIFEKQILVCLTEERSMDVIF